MRAKPLQYERVNRDLWQQAWALQSLSGELYRLVPPDMPEAASAVAGELSRWAGALGWAYTVAASRAPRHSSARRRALRTSERFYKAAAILRRRTNAALGEHFEWQSLPGTLFAAARALTFRVPYYPPPAEWGRISCYQSLRP